jgi:hypothetical protein
MRKKCDYVQCGFQRGNEYHTAWIPKQFAELNRILKFKMKDGSWDDGWKVISAGNLVKTSDEAANISTAHKKGFGSIR